MKLARFMAPTVPLYGDDGYYTGNRPLTDDERRRYDLGRRAWPFAETLPELAMLTAEWLEGGNLYQPGYGGIAPDPETLPLIPHLAAYNRAGFMTVGSQPGHGPREGYDGWQWSQRAFVAGFTDIDTAHRIASHLADRHGLELMVAAWTLGEHRPDEHRADLTIRVNPNDPREGEVTAADGFPLSGRDIRSIYRGDLTRRQIRALYNAWQVTVIDTQFSERTLLWHALDEALA